MNGSVRAAAGLLVCVLLAGCSGGKSDDGKKAGDGKPAGKKSSLPPMAGTPEGVGFLEGGLGVLTSPDPASAVPFEPEGSRFLLVLKLSVPEETTLAPRAYKLEVKGETFAPEAVSFGNARQTFFSLKEFIADRVKLTLGGGDELDTDKADRLNVCHLADGAVYLLYRVPGTAEATLVYGSERHDFRPTTAADLGFVEPLETAQNDPAPPGPAPPGGVTLEVVRGQLAIASVDEKDTEVFELELELKSSRSEVVELDIRKNFFLQGNDGASGKGKRSRRMFVELDDDTMRLLARTDYYDNRYNERDVKELLDGGVAVRVDPGRPVKLFCVFPQPPFENGLALHFPGKEPIELIPAGDALGEIRPAVPAEVARIPRAPMIGDLKKLHVIDGPIAIVDDEKNQATLQPGGDKRFLALQFDIKGEGEFIPRDYIISDAGGLEYHPQYFSVGKSAARRVPGDGYDALPLKPGRADVPREKKGKFDHYEFATPELLAVYELPVADEYFFTHGTKRLKLTPVARPVSWRTLRPETR